MKWSTSGIWVWSSFAVTKKYEVSMSSDRTTEEFQELCLQKAQTGQNQLFFKQQSPWRAPHRWPWYLYWHYCGDCIIIPAGLTSVAVNHLIISQYISKNSRIWSILLKTATRSLLLFSFSSYLKEYPLFSHLAYIATYFAAVCTKAVTHSGSSKDGCPWLCLARRGSGRKRFLEPTK